MIALPEVANDSFAVLSPRPIAIYDHRSELSGVVPAAATEFQKYLESSAFPLWAVTQVYAAIDDTREANEYFLGIKGRGRAAQARTAFVYLQNMYLDYEDLHITYDEQTIGALDVDPEYQQLLKMAAEPSAPRPAYAVDQLRMHRLSFFLERVSRWWSGTSVLY